VRQLEIEREAIKREKDQKKLEAIQANRQRQGKTRRPARRLAK
jgi:hypothetical protein